MVLLPLPPAGEVRLNNDLRTVNGNLSVNAGTVLSVGNVYSSEGNIALNSSGGNISLNQNVSTAGSISLSASSGGVNLAASRNLRTTGGNIDITASGGLLLAGANTLETTGSGSINITANNVNVQTVALYDTEAGDITIDTVGDLDFQRYKHNQWFSSTGK